MEDRAGCQRYLITSSREDRHFTSMSLSTENVQMLLCPARSPDFSPTENSRCMVTEQLACHHTPVTTVDELGHRVEVAGTSVHVHAIHSLFDSMP
ncbi:hypothetical protein TNCV_2308131 [Trichonephila clavipes]|nr:hypothetical protein TNCV_2308131 [Trichonephila clavipes]